MISPDFSAPFEPASPLAYRDYRLFWLARFSAVMATMAMVVIIAWQVYDVARADYGMSKGDAAFQLGILGLFQFLPLALLTPIAGWVADRFERRRIAILADIIDGSVAAAMAAATMLDVLSLPLLFGLGAAHGVARSFVGPAMSAIAPNIVPPSALPRAIAMNSIAWQAGSVIGPAVAGFLYAANAASPYWFSVALLAISTLAIGAVKPVHPPKLKGLGHPFRQMIDGLTYTMRERFLLGAITLDLFAVLLAGATALLPVFARDILHVGTEGMGLMRAAPAVGAALVALGLSFVPIRRNVGIKMLWAVVVFGLATIGFGLSRNFLLSLALLATLGAADMFSVYVRSSLIQLRTPDAMRGRVSAVSGLAISASNELGEMQSGVAAALIGVTGAVVFGGVGAIVVTALWAWWFPELRQARDFSYRPASDDGPLAPSGSAEHERKGETR